MLEVCQTHSFRLILHDRIKTNHFAMKKLFILAATILFAVQVQAQTLRLPQFFGDGMVLQRGTKIPVWGWAPAGEKVSVSLNGKTVNATVASNGEWSVKLPKMKAGGPYMLKITAGAENKVIRNVLIGDVFLCSGQSNMELPIRRCMDAVKDQVVNYSNTQVRYVKIPQQFNYVRPNDDMRTLGWTSITPENSREMGAVCYFVGRYLQEAENVPIGIINSSVGGTRVECWMDRATLSKFPEYTDELAKRKYFKEDWVDSVRQAENRIGNEWERTNVLKDTVMNRWRQANYDFSAWDSVDVFTNWAFDPDAKTQGNPQTPNRMMPSRNIYGSYYFHRQVYIPIGLAGHSALLRLGAMKDADSVFVNGTLVGNTTYEYPPRNYTIPEGVLRAGDNDIVIHLVAQSGRPNFTSGKLYQLEVGDLIIPFHSKWQMRRGSAMSAKPGSTYFVDTPTGLYNAMIAPLRQYAFRGAVWYQGESNTNNAKLYAPLLKAMVGNWREQFGHKFPMVIVQLAGYMSHHNEPLQQSGWCDIRLAQLQAAQELSKSGIATAIDVGEWNDIHPQKKDVLGMRIAKQLRRLVYGEKNLVAEGPLPLSAKVKNGEIIVKFSEKTGELRQSNSLEAFSVAGADGKFVWAKAHTLGKYSVVVTVPFGMTPKTLRYAYDDYPSLSLYNTDGIPSGTFQLDLR